MNEIESVVDNALRPYGFLKKGKTWILTGPETVSEIELSKDRWKKDQSYLGWKISVHTLNPATKTAQKVWHLFGWSYSTDVSQKVELEHCLNSSYENVSGLPRIGLFAEILEKRFVPFVMSLQAVADIKHAHECGKLRGFGMRVELQNLIANMQKSPNPRTTPEDKADR